MSKQKVKNLDPFPKLPQISEEILTFWKKNDVFLKSVEQRSVDKPYSFYDGPPFVTGTPHYGHLVGSIAKDVIPRFFTMKGFRVRRVWGWDCHGLPIENKVEEKLGLKNRREIETHGINKFLAECRSYVEEVSAEWQWYVDHIGRWVDMENSYRTMDLDYMESVIWVFKQLYDQDLIYQGIRTSLYCPRCGTPISNFEIAMDNSYREMEDPAVTPQFKLLTGKREGAFLLAWTTTPWTLPSNRALVIDPKVPYVLFQAGERSEEFIMAKDRIAEVLEENYQIKESFLGEELLGLSYEPLYDFFPPNEKDFKIYSYPEMVNMEEGTGIVHSAPGFGEIDTEMGREKGLTLMTSVDEEGKFIPEVKNWAGVYVKEADPLIIKDLWERKLLFKEERIMHRYPYCYRCETPLIQRAQKSWFVNIQKLKSRLLETNSHINWVPDHFKEGRFHKGVEQAPDWCISRTRYWATIMPVWVCEDCGEIEVVGSRQEIEEKSGSPVKDLHRSGVDHLKFKCPYCGGVMSRVPEVLDCWLESGSMPYAQRHYPFENEEDFKKSFPGDYIAEYTGQVRAWFYVLHVLSNALFQSHCFKNVIVTGVMQGTDGRKMSKSYKNYPDPRKIIEQYGGDALRLYLMGSPIMQGRDVAMTEGDELEEKVKTIIIPLWNVVRYLLTYSQLNDLSLVDLDDLSWQKEIKDLHILDQWLLSRTNQFVSELEINLENYRVPEAVDLIQPMINDLSSWYLRRSRDRFIAQDKEVYQVLYFALKVIITTISPIMPFITEYLFQVLRTDEDLESVHLENWVKLPSDFKNQDLLEQMILVRNVVEQAHSQRRDKGLKIRQPLGKAVVSGASGISPDLWQIVCEEINVKKIETISGDQLKIELDEKITPELKTEGFLREIKRDIQNLRKKAKCQRDEQVLVYWQTEDKILRQIILDHQSDLKDQVIASDLIEGKGERKTDCTEKEFSWDNSALYLQVCRQM